MAVKKARTKARKAAPKKAAPAKKATAVKKTTAAAKASTRTKKGSAYECRVCGLVVSVVDECGCVETCDLICCEESMKPKKGKAA
jgi:hypothetical protein